VKRKKLIIGIAGAMLLLFGGSALAEGKYKTITVYFERIVYEMNGSVLGESSDTLLYNGTIYMPVKELAEMLGAETAWNAGRSTLSLDFLHEGNQAELSDTIRKGIYQYAVLENNAILKALVDSFKQDDMTKAKTAIQRYETLRTNMLGIPDRDAAAYAAKSKAAAELMRSGWSSKKLDNYSIAWTIFNDNQAKLNNHLKTKIQALSPITE